MSDRPSLTLKRTLNASPAQVYAAWTEARQLMRWMGPEGVETLKAETDVRVGGPFRVLMRAPDGEEHDVSGIYREVVQNKKLVFTWAWKSTPERQSLVTVTIAGEGKGTILTLLHEQFFDDKARDDHAHGWSGALDKLVRYFE